MRVSDATNAESRSESRTAIAIPFSFSLLQQQLSPSLFTSKSPQNPLLFPYHLSLGRPYCCCCCYFSLLLLELHAVASRSRKTSLDKSIARLDAIAH